MEEMKLIDWTKPIEVVKPGLDPLPGHFIGRSPLGERPFVVDWQMKNGNRETVRVDECGRNLGNYAIVRNVAPPDYSKATTPKGRAVEFWNVRPDSPSCLAICEGSHLLVYRDGRIGFISFGSSSLVPNAWPFPACTLANIDAFIDAQPKPAESKPATDCEGHLPTPHEPVKGVFLWNTDEWSAKNANNGAYISVDDSTIRGFIYPDGRVAQHISFVAAFPRAVTNPKHSPDDLRKFRDEIRAERAGKANPAYGPWTFETMPIEGVISKKKSTGKSYAAYPMPIGVYIIHTTGDAAVLTYEELFDQHEQLDGTPCGVKA